MRALVWSLRRRLGWILLGAALAAAATSVYSLLQDEKYSATAKLSRPVGSSDRVRAIETLARRARAQLRRRSDPATGDTAPNIALREKDDPPVIEIEATAGDPRMAARVANAFASEVQADQAVLDRAMPPSSPSSPRPVRNTLLGGLAGLVLGLGLTLVRARADWRLRIPSEFEDAFGLPVLVALPESHALSRRLGTTNDLPSYEAEAFQVLDANLRRVGSAGTIDSVLVTSTAAQGGTSTVAFNLAAAATVNHDVLLIEAEFRKPTLARSLGLPSNGGLASVLMGETAVWDACHQVLLLHRNGNGAGEPPTLDVLPAGAWRPGLNELVASQRMTDILRNCRRSYGLVVIDSPPLGKVPATSSLIREVGGLIVVGRMGKLKNKHAIHLRDRLAGVDAPTLGIVANFADVDCREAHAMPRARLRPSGVPTSM